MKPIDNILRALGDYKRQRNGYVARCPSHDDKNPSLRVGEGDGGRVLIKCRAGCPTPKVLQAIGLSIRDLFPRNEAGRAATPARKRTFEIPDPAPPASTWRDVAKACFDHPRAAPGREWLSRKLGVTTAALVALRCGWINPAVLEAFKNARTEGAFTFPERDGRGRIVGISLRWPDGEKGFVAGGNRGLTIPAGLHATPGIVACVEGASDTAALHTLGIAGVGRPSCNGGADALARLLRRREAVIVGEEDRKPGFEKRRHWTDVPMTDTAGVIRRIAEYAALERGRAIDWVPLDRKIGMSWPGLEGAFAIASKLATYWKRPVYWAMPPADSKDVRAWLIRHGEEADFMAAIHFRAVGADQAVAELTKLRQAKQAGRTKARDFKAGA
jgi:hypothetical protein